MPLSASCPTDTRLYPKSGMNRTRRRRIFACSNGTMTSPQRLATIGDSFASSIVCDSHVRRLGNSRQFLLFANLKSPAKSAGLWHQVRIKSRNIRKVRSVVQKLLASILQTKIFSVQLASSRSSHFTISILTSVRRIENRKIKF